MRLYRRGRTWWCWYYDATGARVYASTRCHDRRAAEHAARDLERSAVDPAYRAAHGATMTDAVAALVRQRTEDARAGARSMHTAVMHRVKGGHLIRLLGDVPLRHLTGAHGDEYVSQRRAEHAAPATIHKELTTWRAALKLARRRGVWSGDPSAVVPTIALAYTPRSRWLTPNDLRRTCGTWLRAGGCAPDIVAAVLGHADSRMVERVYGRLDVAQLAGRIASALGCSTGVTDSADDSALDALGGQSTRVAVADSVPRVGIEPTTRGFSEPSSGWRSPQEQATRRRSTGAAVVDLSQRVRRTEPRTVAR